MVSNSSLHPLTYLQGAAQNIDDDDDSGKPENPDLAVAMNKRLGDFFEGTNTLLDKTLLAIFGVHSGSSKEESTQFVRDMAGNMSSNGVPSLDKNAKVPIAELLKGGQWLAPVPLSEIN